MIKKKKLIWVLIIFNIMFSRNIFATSNNLSTCISNPKLQQTRSQELQKLLVQDQLDRKWDLTNPNPQTAAKMYQRDLIRRKRIGEIFAEGCLKTPADYLAASMIYQHGEVPDHFYQAYVWAKRAIELGAKNSKDMVAITIDRYLIAIGKKQLFGSQFFATEPKTTKLVFCIQQIEPSFPDSLRKAYSGYSLKKRQDLYIKNLKINYRLKQCGNNLQPTPKGTIPGLW